MPPLFSDPSHGETWGMLSVDPAFPQDSREDGGERRFMQAVWPRLRFQWGSLCAS